MLLNDFDLCPQNIIGSGSVRVHLHKILKVRVRFRFTDLKYQKFGFGSASMISSLNGSGLFAFTEKKRFLPVRGSGSVRLPEKKVAKNVNLFHQQIKKFILAVTFNLKQRCPQKKTTKPVKFPFH